MTEAWEKYLLGKAELHGMRTRKKRTNVVSRGVGVLNGKLSSRNLKNEEGNTSRQEEEALLVAAAEVSCREEESGTSKRGGRARGRGRGRGRSRGTGSGRGKHKGKADAISDNTISMEDLIDQREGENAPPEERQKEAEAAMNNQGSGKPCPPVHFYALESEQRILDILRPSFVIVYDPEMAFVREMEVYKAENPSKSLKVYFLFYDNSTEAQKFEASIRRENSAFESLIRQKASMMIPVDQV